MRKAWILYPLIRLGLFFGIFAIFALLNFNVYFAAIIAAALSFALSLLLLDKQRDRISEAVHQKIARGQDGSYSDSESDLENELLDQQQEIRARSQDSGAKPGVDDEKTKPEH